jgi:dephospho-CoA kinase
MIKIGITGGIGSGKSIIATLLSMHEIPVYIADEESKRLAATSPIIKERLIALFGNNMYTDKGLDKALLASYIFNNPEYLKQVNAIIHPEVNKHFTQWVKKSNRKICAMESAILFESGFDSIVDIRLMVYAPLELRISRVLKRDNSTQEEIIRRINNQLSDETKKECSDYVILNDDIHALIPQVNKFLSEIRNL